MSGSTQYEMVVASNTDTTNLESCCRFCWEDITQTQLQTGQYVNLGCACTGLNSKAHRECTKKWFKNRKEGTQCEVCREDCKGIPRDNKYELPNGKRKTLQEILAKKNAAMNRSSLESIASGMNKIKKRFMCAHVRVSDEQPAANDDDWWYN